MQRSLIPDFKKYVIRSGEERQLYICNDCNCLFSETKNTVPEGLRTPVSRITMILTALSEGMGINALTGTFSVGEKKHLSLAGATVILTASLDAVFTVSSVCSINC